MQMKLIPTLNNPFNFFSALAPARPLKAREKASTLQATHAHRADSVISARRTALQSTWQVGSDGRLMLKWQINSYI
jgi:hypothetical protein